MLKHIFQKLSYEVVESETGLEYVGDVKDHENVFVVANFREEVFQNLDKAEVRIIGPPVVIKSARDNEVSINAVSPVTSESKTYHISVGY